MAGEHGVDGQGVTLGEPEAFGVFINDKDAAITIFAAEKDDGVMSEAVIHGGEPFDAARVVEVGDNMDIAAEGGKELAGGDVPIAIEPSAAFPAGKSLEDFLVTGVGESVVHDARGDEAGIGLCALVEGQNELISVPGVADAARIGGRVDAGAPAGPGSAATGGDVLMFARGEGGSFLDADEVVFEAEISVDVALILEMATDNA